MAKTLSRVNYDILAKTGYGFPYGIDLTIPGTVAATTTWDQWFVPIELSVTNGGHACRLGSIQFYAQTASADAGTSHSEVYIIKKIDSAGNVLDANVATFTILKTVQNATIDLRNPTTGKGYPLKPGEGLQLSTTTASLTTPSGNVRFHATGVAYGASV